MKPILKWTGGKSSEIPVIMEHIPKSFDRYVEPFLGGGALYFHLEHPKNIVNDFNSELIQFYETIRDDFDAFRKPLDLIDKVKWEISKSNVQSFDIDLIDQLMAGNHVFRAYCDREYRAKHKLFAKLARKGTILDRDEQSKSFQTSLHAALYYTYRDYYNESLKRTIDVNHSSNWFVMRELAYSGMFRFSKTGKFNVPYGGKSYDAKRFSTKLDRIAELRSTEFYVNTEFNCGDFQNLFQKHDYFTENDFVFLDPPYDSEFSQYNKDQDFDVASQRRLANHVGMLKAKWMMVIKETPLISSLYGEYNISTFDKKYSVNFHNRNDQECQHLIITNYIP